MIKKAEKTLNYSENYENLPFVMPGMDSLQTEAFSRYRGPYQPGRIAARHKTVYDVQTPGGKFRAGASGALLRLGKIPAVGDFVAVLDQPDEGKRMIVDILPRRSVFARKAPGEGGFSQVMAANIDTVFIVTSAGCDFSPRRLERYLAIVHAAGAEPVIVINKSDLLEDEGSILSEAKAAAGSVPVITISALKCDGLKKLEKFLKPENTVSIVGSSGVGKSTLINALLNSSVQETSDVRGFDEKGRHTTTVRRLFSLTCGAYIIDNPGVREVAPGDTSGIDETFPEIAEFASECRYRNCRHTDEPGCAVTEAAEAGLIPKERLESYRRLMKETEFIAEKEEIGSKRLEKKRHKWIKKAGKIIREERGK